MEGSRRRFLEMVGASGASLPGTLLTSGESGAAAGSLRRGTRQPVASGGVLDVSAFGAVGDGRTLATAALQTAIDACGARGGGTAGRYLSGALFLRSRVHLRLGTGATLVASSRAEDFPPLKGRDEGIERTVHASLLTGLDLETVSITGEGTIEGQGQRWWEAFEETMKIRIAAKLPREAESPPGSPLKWPRPRIVNLIRCRDARIEGLTIRNAPFYGIHLVYCQNVVVDSVSTRQDVTAHNTAINVDSSRCVRISNCVLSQGGDGVGIKAGYNEEGRRVGIAAEDILITNCHMLHNGDSGVAIGSETAAGIRNVLISHCVIAGSGNGVYVRSPRGRGGVVERIRVDNLVLDGIQEVGLRISHFFDSVRMGVIKGGSMRRDLEISRSRKVPVDEGTPTFRDFVFAGISVGQARDVAIVEGLPERPIRGLSFQDITAARASGGVSLSQAAEVSISNLAVQALESAAVDAREVERLEIHRLRWARPAAASPAIWLEDVASAFIHGCDIGDAGPGYEWLRQQQSRDVTLGTNNVPARAPQQVKKS